MQSNWIFSLLLIDSLSGAKCDLHEQVAHFIFYREANICSHYWIPFVATIQQLLYFVSVLHQTTTRQLFVPFSREVVRLQFMLTIEDTKFSTYTSNKTWNVSAQVATCSAKTIGGSRGRVAGVATPPFGKFLNLSGYPCLSLFHTKKNVIISYCFMR